MANPKKQKQPAASDVLARPFDQHAQEMSYRHGGWTFHLKLTKRAYQALRAEAIDALLSEFPALPKDEPEEPEREPDAKPK